MIIFRVQWPDPKTNIIAPCCSLLLACTVYSILQAANDDHRPKELDDGQNLQLTVLAIRAVASPQLLGISGNKNKNIKSLILLHTQHVKI